MPPFVADTTFQLQFVVVHLCCTGCIVILLGFSLHLLAKEFLLFRQVLLDEAVLAHLLTNLVKQGAEKYKNNLILTNTHHDGPPFPKKSHKQATTKATIYNISFRN